VGCYNSEKEKAEIQMEYLPPLTNLGSVASEEYLI
jgi:hypothetical protein